MNSWYSPLVGLEWFSWKFYQRCVKQHGESGLTKACLESQISMKEAEDMVMKVKRWQSLDVCHDISEKSDLGDWAGHRQREKPACWKHSQHGQVWSIYRSDLFWLQNMNLPTQEVLGKVHASVRLSPPLPHCRCMWLVGLLWLVTGWVKASKPMFLLIFVMNFHCKMTEWINVKNYCLGEHNQRVDQALVSRQIRACSKVNQ